MKVYYSLFLLLIFSLDVNAQVYEISGSPFATEGAPLPDHIKATEKTIIVEPRRNVWGGYSSKGKLIRWGIATAGATECPENHYSYRTTVGRFRIYSLGNESCTSEKYNNASMPYCMYFNGGQALHGSSDIQFNNVSHGCVRVHIEDAKWLRYHFVEKPDSHNHYQGTQIVIHTY